MTDEDGNPLTPPRNMTVSAFMEVWVIFWMKSAMAVVGVIYAIYLDIKEKRTDRKYLKLLFSRQELTKWYWVSLIWCLADISEQVAAGRIAVSTYTVLSQGRLLA